MDHFYTLQCSDSQNWKRDTTNYVAVIGDPYSGKTVFLKQIYLQYQKSLIPVATRKLFVVDILRYFIRNLKVVAEESNCDYKTTFLSTLDSNWENKDENYYRSLFGVIKNMISSLENSGIVTFLRYLQMKKKIEYWFPHMLNDMDKYFAKNYCPSIYDFINIVSLPTQTLQFRAVRGVFNVTGLDFPLPSEWMMKENRQFIIIMDLMDDDSLCYAIDAFKNICCNENCFGHSRVDIVFNKYNEFIEIAASCFTFPGYNRKESPFEFILHQFNSKITTYTRNCTFFYHSVDVAKSFEVRDIARKIFGRTMLNLKV